MTDADKNQAQAMLNAAIAQRNQAMDQCIQLAAAIAQRNQAMDQCIQLAAALQLANDRIAELEKPKDVPE
jgi:hypothetical protein